MGCVVSSPAALNPRTKKTRAITGEANGYDLAMSGDIGYPRDFHARYEQGKLLGHGHFGYTYLATNIQTGDKVAVKIIRKNLMAESINVEDMKREVNILATLSGHENVVRFFQAFEDDVHVYIVMELCEGGELLNRIRSKRGHYSEKDAAKVVRQMLMVAAHCHLSGIVHRDVKPENFLFQSQAEDSLLKMTDFGLSNYIKPDKKFTDTVGTPYYIAPEVLQGKSGPESDVWSIGVITFILLSGSHPFMGKSKESIFEEVLRWKLEFREKAWKPISPHAKDFVKKLLTKDPRARLTAAQALSHPWVREGGKAYGMPLDISVLSKMRDFVNHTHMEQIALRALARTLDSEEIATLHDQFNVIDVDKNGTLSREEMIQALAKDRAWEVTDLNVEEILKAMDNNQDGCIDFNEFVAAALHVHQFKEFHAEKWWTRSLAAFERLDIDKDGYITPDELRKYTGVKGSIDNILDGADTDRDGRICLHEFQNLLRRLENTNLTNRMIGISMQICSTRMFRPWGVHLSNY